jgi:hypothetical protein
LKEYEVYFFKVEKVAPLPVSNLPAAWAKAINIEYSSGAYSIA